MLCRYSLYDLLCLSLLDGSFLSVYTFFFYFVAAYFADFKITLVITAKTITIYESICPQEMLSRFALWMLFPSLFVCLHTVDAQDMLAHCIPGSLSVCFEFKKRI